MQFNKYGEHCEPPDASCNSTGTVKSVVKICVTSMVKSAVNKSAKKVVKKVVKNIKNDVLGDLNLPFRVLVHYNIYYYLNRCYFFL